MQGAGPLVRCRFNACYEDAHAEAHSAVSCAGEKTLPDLWRGIVFSRPHPSAVRGPTGRRATEPADSTEENPGSQVQQDRASVMGKEVSQMRRAGARSQ